MDLPLDASPADPSPRLLREPGEGGRLRARLEGDWTLLALRERVEALRGELGEVPTANVSWDLSAVRRLDPTGALLLWQAWGRR